MKKSAANHFLSLFSLILLTSAASSYSVTSSNTNLQSTELQSKTTKEIVSTLESRHYFDILINDSLSARFLDNYLERLDPTKSFFFQSDIDEFKNKQFLLDDELKKGDNSTGFIIYQRLADRMTVRLNKTIEAINEIKPPLLFNKDESISTDTENAAWPLNEKQADELWRKRIKSYFLTQKLAGEAFDKSKESIIKRYQAQSKRINENSVEDVYEIYINAFTELYDPHTNYFSPRSSESFSIRMSLSLEGIGAVLQTEDGFTKVVRIVTAGPADKQGELKPADKISGVAQGTDGEIINVVGWRLNEVVDLIRGPKGSIVRLEVTSGKTADSVSKIIQIKRDKVKLEDQAAQKGVLEIAHKDKTFKVGVINIPTFYLDFEAYRKRDPNYRSTAKDVYRLLTELEQENVDGIIVDLRNNGGGSLYEATAVTDLFIDKGPVVQIGKIGAGGGHKTENYSRNNALYRGPLVVLINRLSASASEIFAGAIQDYKRGVIVGSQSFGKGTVQTLTPLKTQGELKITESKFYRVSGESTQHRGVIPDITMPELINVDEVGESSYDTALPWSEIQKVRYGSYFLPDSMLNKMVKNHEQRIATDPDFIYLNARKSLLDNLASATSISLKESQRIKEKEALEKQTLSIENKRRTAKGLTPYTNYEAFKNAADERDEAAAAAAGTTTIDTKDDAILKEAGYILKDYVDILMSTEDDKVATSRQK